MTLKTTLTPAEHANVVQGLQMPLDVTGSQAGAISTGTKQQFLADGPMAIRNLRARLGTCGTGAGPSVVEVKKNGVVVASVSIAHDAVDPAQLVGLPTTDALAKVEAGDLIEIAVSAVATAAADLTATAHVDRRFE